MNPKKNRRNRRRTGRAVDNDAAFRNLQYRALLAVTRVIGACVSMAHQFDIRRTQIVSNEECGGLFWDTNHKTITWLEQDARNAIDAYNAHMMRRRSKVEAAKHRRTTRG